MKDFILLNCDTPLEMFYDKFCQHGWGKIEAEESSDGGWSNCVPNDEWKSLELKKINNSNTIRTNQECIGDYGVMFDDDNFGYIFDYLVSRDVHFVINNKEERFEEKRCKLLGTPRKRIARIKHDIWARTKGYIDSHDKEVVEFVTHTK
nr:hypothetical protein [Tanacetum cinerariifolium]